MRHYCWHIALVAGCILALSSTACQKERTWNDPGPEGTFRAYLMHWFHGEREKAFEMIVPDDREELTRPLETLESRLDDSSLPAPHEMLITGRVDNPYDIKSMELTETLGQRPESGTTVTIELSYHDGREGRAQLVWQDRQWYVDLPLESEAEATFSTGESSTHEDTTTDGETGAEADRGARGDAR